MDFSSKDSPRTHQIFSPLLAAYAVSRNEPGTITCVGPPAGVYTIFVTGVSGLGGVGEEPFVAVASVESCASVDIDQNGAVHKGYAAKDLVAAVNVSGLSNLNLTIGSDSTSGTTIYGTGTYNGINWTGSVVLVGLSNSRFELPIVDTVLKGIQVRGSFLGTRQDLDDALQLAASGKVKPHVETHPLELTPVLLGRLQRGELMGRAVIVF